MTRLGWRTLARRAVRWRVQYERRPDVVAARELFGSEEVPGAPMVQEAIDAGLTQNEWDAIGAMESVQEAEWEARVS